MKNIFKLFLFSLLAASCSHKPGTAEPEVGLNYSSIYGIWELVSFNGDAIGVAAGDTRYNYLVIGRTENPDTRTRRIDQYSNMDSYISSHTEIDYFLEEDENGVYYITGSYAHWGADFGPYAISGLTADDMTLTISGDSGDDVLVYRRCASVPEEIVAGTKSL